MIKKIAVNRFLVFMFAIGTVALTSVSALGEHMNPDDRQVLIDLYNSTNGEGWLHKDNWLDPARDDWYGITLDELGRVIALRLSANELSGSIPDSLGQLDALREIRLDHNQLSGSIPKSLGQIPAWVHLDLSHNQLEGSIPDSLGNVNFFSELNLSNNQLSGTIPGTLADSIHCSPNSPKSHITLDFSNNQLKEPLPKHLYCIGVNGEVHLAGNQFTSEELASFQSAVLKAKQEEQERVRSQEARFDKSQEGQFEMQMFQVTVMAFGIVIAIGLFIFLLLMQVK